MENYLEYLNESPTVFFKCRNEPGWPIEFVTENIKSIFGYNSEDFISQKIKFIDIVYEIDRKQLSDEIDFIVNNLDLDKYEFKPYRFITKNKKILWVQDITNLKKDKSGKVNYFHCYITDITNQIKKDEKLHISEDIISTIYNNSFQFIGLMENDGTLIRANKTSLEFVNIKESDVIGKKFWDCPWWEHSIDDQEELKKDVALASKGEFIRKKKVHFDPFGNKIYVDFSIKPVFNSNNEVIYLIPEGHNITDNVLKEKELDKYMSIINENVLISITDLDGKILNCSDKFCEVSGYSKEELIGNRHNIMKDPNTPEEFYKELWQTITSGHIWKGEHKNYNKKGEAFYVENIITPNFNTNDEMIGFTSIYNDITLRKEISELSITDELTKLYNRRHFNSVLDSELKKSLRHKHNFTLMILDVDYFKQYNDTYGHFEGDNALINVANSLKETLNRPDDYIFRLGGEEFSIITSNIDTIGVEQLAQKIKKSIEKLNIKHEKSDISNSLTISIGVKTINPKKDSLCHEEIYKCADKALYEAKQKGRNRVIVC